MSSSSSSLSAIGVTVVVGLLYCLVIVDGFGLKCANPSTIDTVQVSSYMGRWYEITRNDKFAQQFEKDLYCITANYTLNSDGTVKVVNGGRVGAPNGPVKDAIGKAKQVKGGKLEVSFFGPFYGPYWIVELLGNATTPAPGGYEVSLVYSCEEVLGIGVQDFWVLSRTPTLPANITLDYLFGLATNKGIPVPTLNMTATYQGRDCVY